MSRLPQRSRLAGLAVLTIALAGAALWLAMRPSPQKLLERGLAAGPRDGAAAERLLREAIRASGGHYPDAEIALCQVLLERGDWDEAASQFAAVNKEACRSDLLLDFGRAALAAGYERQGIAALEAVRRRGNRDAASALELLIEIARMWGATDDVISCARDWTELEPDNPRPWIVLIQTLKNEDRRDAECLDAVRRALARNLSDDVVRELKHRLVEQLIVCGDAEGTRRELEALTQTEGETFRVHLLQVDQYRLEGLPEKALDVMERVFREARDPAEACFNRGVIYHDLGRYADAVRDLERAVAAQPMNSSAHFKLSEAYRALGRQDPAARHRAIADGINAKQLEIATLQKQISRDHADAAIPRQLAKLYRELGAEEAANAWEKRAENFERKKP